MMEFFAEKAADYAAGGPLGWLLLAWWGFVAFTLMLLVLAGAYHAGRAFARGFGRGVREGLASEPEPEPTESNTPPA